MKFQKTWVGFTQFFLKTHQELCEPSDLTIEDSGTHHTVMVRIVVAGIQESLQQEKSLTGNMTTMEEPINHVENAIKSTQKQLATQLQQIQAMLQTMHV